jgi:hypothetical protein
MGKKLLLSPSADEFCIICLKLGLMIKDTSNERFWRIKFLDGATSKLEKHAET